MTVKRKRVMESGRTQIGKPTLAEKASGFEATHIIGKLKVIPKGISLNDSSFPASTAASI